MSDNAPVNKVVARPLNIAHVGCMIHNINCGVNRMVKNDGQLSSVQDSIHETMA